ncbi:DUF6578 domain-containing protein [Streptomyces sp. NPDC100445]|uniref:DUF6578 domain-containing protein n=1 Tax=Streptomyces sp. NPDC100445 TaxID=3366102 RepID=UPI0038219BDF
MALTRVFYEDWQMECCGTPFAVGDEVAWPLAVHGDGERGEDPGYGAGARVENHADVGQETLGRVHAIELVHQEHVVLTDPRAAERLDRAPDPDAESEGALLLPSPYQMEAVPGAWTLEPVTACPKWFRSEEPGRGPGPHRIRRTQGALVTLDVTGVRDIPAEESGTTPEEPGDRH